MRENWLKWDEADEAGALNSLSPGVVRNATRLVNYGKVLSLAQPLSSAIPVPKRRAAVQHLMSRDGGDYAAGRGRPGGFQVAEDIVIMSVHSGTHIDALCHCWYEDRLYNGFQATEVRSDGARRLGVEKMPPIVSRGVLIDLVAQAGGVPLADGTSIGAAMLRTSLESNGVTLQEGDVVLLRTGWLERQVADVEPDFNAEPGIDIDAALFLARAGVAAIGADNYAVEVLPFPEGTVFPVHQRLIRDFGIPLMEGLSLAALARENAATFLFVAAALPISGATGSPINPVAIL